MKDFTKGPILKALVSLSLPIVLTNMLHTAYQLVDTFWVGRLGAEAVAAVSLSFPIIFLLITLGGGFTIAGTILVAQYKGRKDDAQVEHITAQTVVLMLIVSFIIGATGILIAEPIMQLIGAEADVLPQAVSYLTISFYGIPFMFGFFIFQSLMRGIGEVYLPMKIVLVTVILNLGLDPLFIMGWGPIPAYGVGGAAIATIITQGIATLIGYALLFRGNHGIKLTLKKFKFDGPLIKKMFGLGIPSSIEGSMNALGLTIMSFLVATFGTTIVAAYGIGIRILSFIIIPAFGLSMATSTLVGQNIGAEKPKRAEKIAKKSAVIGFGTIVALSIVIFFAADYLAQAFLDGEQSVINEAALFIRYLCFCFGFLGFQLILNGAYSGAGNTRVSMIFSIISVWVFQFPIAYILSKHTDLGARGLWLAYPISSFCNASISLIYFRMGRWKNKRIIPTKQEKMEQAVTKEAKIEEGLQ